MRIETERLIFRKWNEYDVDFIVDGLNDFEVAKNLTSPFPYVKQYAIDYIQKHEEHKDSDFVFAIVCKENGEVIGGTNITLNEEGEYRGGIWIRKKYQGKGYGTEIWTARAKFAFDVLGLNEIYNGFYYFNERSKKMQLKIGYKIIGEKENYCPALKSSVKEIVTRLKKDDFEKYYKTIPFKFLVK